jgi:hypothetical protein
MTNVLMSPASLLLPIPRPDAIRIGLTLLAVGLANLAPGKFYNGGTTDGWKLVFLPERSRVAARVHELVSDADWYDRPDAFDVLVEGLLIALPEAIDSVRDLDRRPEAVQRFFRQPWTLPARPKAFLPLLVYALTLSVVSDGELPAEIADLAAERAEWAVEHVRTGSPDDDENTAEARHTLAMARLRQGRPDEVEPLCAAALASELDPKDRATVLATVAMARHARLLSGRPQLDEALRLDPDAAMVSEAARFLDDQDAAVTAYYRRLRRVGDGAQGEPRSAPGIP